jgi:murein L,D-transpeptidase YafK
MKSFNTLATFIIISSFLLMPCVSTGKPTSSNTNQSSREADGLAQLFKAAVA